MNLFLFSLVGSVLGHVAPGPVHNHAPTAEAVRRLGEGDAASKKKIKQIEVKLNAKIPEVLVNTKILLGDDHGRVIAMEELEKKLPEMMKQVRINLEQGLSGNLTSAISNVTSQDPKYARTIADKINADLSAHGGNKVPYLNSLITADKEESANEGSGNGIFDHETVTGGHFTQEDLLTQSVQGKLATKDIVTSVGNGQTTVTMDLPMVFT